MNVVCGNCGANVSQSQNHAFSCSSRPIEERERIKASEARIRELQANAYSDWLKRQVGR